MTEFFYADRLFNRLSANLKNDEDIIKAYEHRKIEIAEREADRYYDHYSVYYNSSPATIETHPEMYDEHGERGWWADNM